LEIGAVVTKDGGNDLISILKGSATGHHRATAVLARLEYQDRRHEVVESRDYVMQECTIKNVEESAVDLRKITSKSTKPSNH
jgi:hypothetical protein